MTCIFLNFNKRYECNKRYGVTIRELFNKRYECNKRYSVHFLAQLIIVLNAISVQNFRIYKGF